MRIIGIDFGTKRVGIAVTDPEQIIGSHHSVIHPLKLMEFLTDYIAKNEVEGIVVGMPKSLMNQATNATPHVVALVKKLKTTFAPIYVETIDERFTSKIATQSILESGVNRKTRQNKSLVDEVSAVIILNDFMELKKNRK
jgi:putative holliday junction resolvase